MQTALLPLALALFPLGSAAKPARADELADVLSAARAAAGGAALRAEPLRARGSASLHGAEGDLALEVLPSGAFRLAVAGPLPDTVAWDGEVAWHSDWSGLPRTLELAEREATILLGAVLGGAWLDAGGLVTAALAPAGAGEGELALELRVKDGLERAVLVLDAASHRVLRLDLDDVVWYFEDYRDTLGFPFPQRLRSVEEGGSEGVFTLASLSRAPKLSAAACARPADLPADVRFDPAVPALLESRRVPSGHVLVHPRLAGQDVGWFILDTGAGALCISSDVADKLGMPAVGSVTADGVGGKVAAPLRRGGELAVGPVTLSAPTWVELDLKFLEPIFGVPVAGILGYDFFARTVVAADYATPRVEVYAPGAYTLPEGAEWGRLVLDSRLPCVEATFEGDRREIFRIDTGADGTVSFNAEAVERLGLLTGRVTKPVQVGGVGGMRTIRSGDLAWFELAGQRRSPLEATFEPEPGPQHSSPHVAGTVGGGLLTPFTLVLDLPSGRIAFVPRAQ